VNLQKEAQVVKALLDKAEQLEGEAAQREADAEDCRWQAARRTSEVINSGITQKAFAAAVGIGAAKVAEMVVVWREYGNFDTNTAGLPRYWDGVFMVRDKSLQSRAAEQGRSPSAVKQGENKARAALKQPSSAKAVLADPEVRQAVVNAVAELPEETQDNILRELHQKKLERAGADFSMPHRKASEAATDEFLQPVRDALKSVKGVFRAVAVLESAAAEVRSLPADLSDEERREVDAAVDDVILARTEMHMQTEVEP
jgi:hypothetical protein